MRYYSTQRPFGPGTFPRQDGTETITNFDGPTYCEEIGREAWGYIDYEQALSPEQAASYELTPAKMVAEYVVYRCPDGLVLPVHDGLRRSCRQIPPCIFSHGRPP